MKVNMDHRATLDWSYKGMRTLVLESDSLKVSILLDKGSDIFELIYKPLGVDVLWHSPIGYRNPAGYVLNGASLENSFHDFYGGGWNDIFPNYGKSSSNRGTEFGEHGESALLSWSCLHTSEENNSASGQLAVRCVRYPLRAEKTLSLSESELRISEDIVNTADHEIEFSWAQHIAYGEPFIGPGTKIEIPGGAAKTSTFPVHGSRLKQETNFKWPSAPATSGKDIDLTRIPARSERIQEDFPIIELASAEYSLYNSDLDLGVKVSWDREVFPHLWYWLNWGVPDYAYFGRGRTLALEPTTSFTGGGLAADIKGGCAKVLMPGSKLHAEVKMEFSQMKAHK
jgi:Domain of unknown function (DUF4432)